MRESDTAAVTEINMNTVNSTKANLRKKEIFVTVCTSINLEGTLM